MQDVVSGALIERGKTLVAGAPRYDFGPAIAVWIGASVLSVLLATFLWRVRASD